MEHWITTPLGVFAYVSIGILIAVVLREFINHEEDKRKKKEPKVPVWAFIAFILGWPFILLFFIVAGVFLLTIGLKGILNYKI